RTHDFCIRKWVYATTPAFRDALSLSLRHGNEVVPDWVKDKLPNGQTHGDVPPPTTASAMLPLRIDDRPYILGRMTDPENSGHLIVALYDTQRGFATVHYVNKDGNAALLGDTAEILRKVIHDYLNAESAFAKSQRACRSSSAVVAWSSLAPAQNWKRWPAC
ncbi:hypothetical protein, partial [Cupriavidus sp. SK-4]|uniref:hypothetical protein n=1 Tax=Cupriavidus sp. SK-4 TaxID=574750 RepID=UPI001377C8BA